MSAVADRLYFRRRLANGAAMLLSGAATVFGLFWLVRILWTTVSRGLAAFGPHLFTQMTPPPGEVSGGLLNAHAGSLSMCTLAVAMATPVGIAAGTYIAEYARGQIEQARGRDEAHLVHGLVDERRTGGVVHRGKLTPAPLGAGVY